MNSFIITSSTYPLTSAYTVSQSISGTSMSFVPMHKPSSSWRKFIHVSAQYPVSESSVTFIPAEKTTTEGPTVLKPAPFPEDYDAQIDEFLRFIDSLEPQTEVANDIVAQ
ncbi:MAG: hypothetical protein ACR2H5_26655 [Ktedonobacteraceae bacterium]